MVDDSIKLPLRGEKAPADYASIHNSPQRPGWQRPEMLALPSVCMCILVVELCERLAYYTFTGTQEFFLERIGYSLAEAGGINATMGTLCMGWALFTGWMADVVLGRYRTIALFGSLYVCGSVLAAYAAFPSVSSSKVYLVGLMGLVPIGTAGIKANISNFGADQYDTSDPAQALGQERFFSWFYLSINIGSAVAYGCLTTYASNGGLGIPQKYGYFIVYLIAAAAMALGLSIFLSARDKYRVIPIQRQSALGKVMNTIRLAAGSGSRSAMFVLAGLGLLAKAIIMTVMQALLPEAWGVNKFLVAGAFICAAFGIVFVVVPCLDPEDWVPRSAQPEGDSPTLADVRDYLRLLPVLFMANLAFSALYNSMQYWYQQQACQMDLRIPWAASGPDQAQFSGSFFMIADCLGIVIATPVAIRWANPFVEFMTRTPLTHWSKYLIGMSFGVISVLMSVHIEQQRRLAPLTGIMSSCAPAGVQMSAMSAAWMLVPFFFMGLGEIYTQPTLMYLAYNQSPPSMRSLTASTSLVIGGVSTAIFALLISALSRFVPNDLNKGHLEFGYIANIFVAGFFLIFCRGCFGVFRERSFLG